MRKVVVGVMVKAKRCAGCGQRKALRFFYRDRRVKDGHQGTCAACRRATGRGPDFRIKTL